MEYQHKKNSENQHIEKNIVIFKCNIRADINFDESYFLRLQNDEGVDNALFKILLQFLRTRCWQDLFGKRSIPPCRKWSNGTNVLF